MSVNLGGENCCLRRFREYKGDDHFVLLMSFKKEEVTRQEEAIGTFMDQVKPLLRNNEIKMATTDAEVQLLLSFDEFKAIPKTMLIATEAGLTCTIEPALSSEIRQKPKGEKDAG